MSQYPSSGVPDNEQKGTRKWDEPLPEAHEVVPGIWKITLPIPFPLRTVNVYALVGRDGWALIDAGIGVPDARAAFQRGLERAGLKLTHLQAIVLTHHHPDHIGLSGELQEQTGAAVYMHPLDEAVLHINWSGSLPERFSRISSFFVRHGLPQTELWYSKVDPAEMRMMISVPPHEAITALEDGREIELAGERYKIFGYQGILMA